MKTIMIIDDDIYIGQLLEEALSREGFRPVRAYSGTEALLLLAAQRPDLILLDLMLPGLSGEELLPKLNGIPVIVLSAKADVGGKVNLLRSGADDYVTKPFDIDELLARIEVQLRIAAGSGSSAVLSFRGVEMDTSSRSVTAECAPVKLTKTEYAILKQLLLSPTRVITKSHILDMISEDTPDCMESSLKVHISNLRRKLRDAGGKDYIESVWGIGFKMREE